jgi:hypothetical protein
MMDGHRPAVWLSDRYAAQQGHGLAQQTCLAHLARDVAYALEASDDPVPFRLKLWLSSAFDLADAATHLAASTLAAKRRALERRLDAILTAYSDETSHRFRSKPATCSEANQPGIPMMPAGVAVWFADGFIELGGRVARQA